MMAIRHFGLDAQFDHHGRFLALICGFRALSVEAVENREDI
jgi:hypothetical protein